MIDIDDWLRELDADDDSEQKNNEEYQKNLFEDATVL